MKFRFGFHKAIGELRLWPPRVRVGALIVGYTWLLAVFYSVPKLFKKPPKGSTRWKEYVKALKYNYSHVEIWIPDEDGRFKSILNIGQPCSHKGCLAHCSHPCEFCGRISGNHYLGQCFSSTTRGDAEGVRFAPASEVLKHPERWDYIEVEVDDERFEVALDEAKRLVGNGYDYGYIISFLQPFIVQKESDWACSEFCDWFGFLNHIPTHRKKWGMPLPMPTDWFKFNADMLRAMGFIVKRHKRISPRRLAYLLAQIFSEPKPV